MPRVPLYEQGQVKSQPLNPEEFGFGVRDTQAVFEPQNTVFQSAERAANTVINIGLKEAERADDLAVTEATTQLLNRKNDLFWNAETGAMRTKRKDALNAPNSYGSEFKKYVSEVESGLKSDRQKLAFRQKASQIETDFNDVLERHAFKEYIELEKETFESGLQSLQNDAVLNYQDPGKIGANLEEQEKLLLSYAEKNGIDPTGDTYKNLVLDTKSKTHTSVIARAVDNGDDLFAKDYMKLAMERGELSTEDLGKVEKVVRAGSVKAEAERISESVLSNPKLTGQAALDEIRRLAGDDADIKQAAIQAYRNTNDFLNYAEKQEQDKLFEDAYDVLYRSQGQDEIPQTIMLKMNKAQTEAIVSARQRMLRGQDVTTDLEEWGKTLEQMSNPEKRGRMSRADILKNPKISYEDKRKLVETLSSAKSGNINPLAYTETESKMITQAAKDMNLNDEETKLFWNTTKQAINYAASQNNGSLSFDQMAEIVKKQSTETIVNKRPIFSKSRYPFQVKPDEIDVDDIPTDIRMQIDSAIKARGLQSSEDLVREFYSRYLKGGGRGQ